MTRIRSLDPAELPPEPRKPEPRYAQCTCGALVRHPSQWPGWWASVLCPKCWRWVFRATAREVEVSTFSAKDRLAVLVARFLAGQD